MMLVDAGYAIGWSWSFSLGPLRVAAMSAGLPAETAILAKGFCTGILRVVLVPAGFPG